MNWKDLVKKVAPALGHALGGPMAGNAAKYISEKILGKTDATENEIEDFVLNANPEKLNELKKIDNEFKLSMQKLGVDVFKLETIDKQHAREFSIKTSLMPQIVLSTIFIGGYFGILYLLFTQKIEMNTALKDMILLLVGLITREVPTIMSFWFGSSFGSKTKDQKN